MKRSILLFLLFSICQISVFAQYTPEKATKDALKDLPTKTSLSYESLTKFYQASVTSGDDGYNFKSSIFGIHKFFAGRCVDLTSYYNSNVGMFERNTELSLGLKKNSNDKYNVLSYGIKYAIVNKGDKAKTNFFKLMLNDNQTAANMILAGEKYRAALQREFDAIDAKKISAEEKKAERDKIEKATAKFAASKDINDLPEALRGLFKNEFTEIKKIYDSLSKSYDMKGVLTLNLESGYDFDSNKINTTTGTLRYVKGLAEADKPLELDVQAGIKFEGDTSKQKADLGRSIMSMSLGFNKVLMRTNSDDPSIEVEISADYRNVLSGTVYQKEYKETKNGVIKLKIHISKQFTIPAVLKYDVEHPNILGFLQLQWNLETKKKS